MTLDTSCTESFWPEILWWPHSWSRYRQTTIILYCIGTVSAESGLTCAHSVMYWIIRYHLDSELSIQYPLENVQTLPVIFWPILYIIYWTYLAISRPIRSWGVLFCYIWAPSVLFGPIRLCRDPFQDCRNASLKSRITLIKLYPKKTLKLFSQK